MSKDTLCFYSVEWLLTFFRV